MALVLMKQFDVYENPSPAGRKAIPFLLVLQHDRTSETRTVVVAPLVPKKNAARMPRSPLYPVLSIGSREHALLIPDLAAIARASLKSRIANQEGDRRRIIDALDLLFTGV